jgi:hypothetical protein
MADIASTATNSGTRQKIKIWRGDVSAALKSYVTVSKIIHENDQHIWRSLRYRHGLHGEENQGRE